MRQGDMRKGGGPFLAPCRKVGRAFRTGITRQKSVRSWQEHLFACERSSLAASRTCTNLGSLPVSSDERFLRGTSIRGSTDGIPAAPGGAVVGFIRRQALSAMASMETTWPTATRGTPAHKKPQPLDSSSIYEARAPTAGLTICCSFASRVFAAAPDECGFCPVISRPSLTT